MPLVIKEKRAGSVGINDGAVEDRQGCTHPISRPRGPVLVRRLIPDLSDGESSRAELSDAALDRLADAGTHRDSARQGVTVLVDRLGKPGVVAMAIAELALQCHPARAFGAGREFGKKDGLPRAAQSRECPVRMERRFRYERLERVEQSVAPGRLLRGDAVPGPEWVRESLVTGLQLRH